MLDWLCCLNNSFYSQIILGFSFSEENFLDDVYREVPRIIPQLCLYPPSTAQSSQNFIPIVPILLVVHLVKALSYTPRNLSLVKNLIPPGGIIRGIPL